MGSWVSGSRTRKCSHFSLHKKIPPLLRGGGAATLPGNVNTPGTRAEDPETEYHHCRSTQGSPIWGGNKHAGKTGFGVGVS